MVFSSSGAVLTMLWVFVFLFRTNQEHNLDWFPRMRAMSLVSSDADGEQNEIRNLQEKLESTMKLVTNLSGQLTELKEQVGGGGGKRSDLIRSVMEKTLEVRHLYWQIQTPRVALSLLQLVALYRAS